MKRLLKNRPLLIIYPAEMKWENEPSDSEQTQAGMFQIVFPPARVFPHVNAATVSEAVSVMIDPVFKDAPSVRKRVLKDLSDIAREAPLRISSECLLLHSHMAASPAPLAMLATRREGFIEDSDSEFSSSEAPRAIILLLGVPEEGAEQHLRRLARIARIFRSERRLDNVCNAESYEAIIAGLSEQ